MLLRKLVIMFKPTNEQGLIVYFAQKAAEHGWEFVKVGTEFPDAVLIINGEEWRVEFEFLASNFLMHQHDPRKCDLIICWENDYPKSALPILAIGKDEWIPQVKAHPNKIEAEYWRRRALRSERKLRNVKEDEVLPDLPLPPQERRDRPIIEMLVDMVINKHVNPSAITVQYIRHQIGPRYNGKQIYLERARRIKDAVEHALYDLQGDR